MPHRLIRVACNLFLIGLLSSTVSAAAADYGEATVGNQPAATQSRPAAVRFADGSAMPADAAATTLTAVPTPAARPDPSLSAPPDEPKPLDSPPPAASAAGEPHVGGAPLVPVPDSKNLGPVEIEVTSFHSITPGVSTRRDVEKAWGKPKQSRRLDAGLTQLYSVDPFPRVEVTYADEQVTSLVIRFQRGFPAAQVAEQLELTKVQPVLVSNELGEILGQSYPERGVLFAFEAANDPSKALKKVTHIVLEPITAEPFVLRAETNIDLRPEFSLHDADQAIRLQPGNARAQWLRSRALTSLGNYEPAATAAIEATRLNPRDARFVVTKAQALKHVGRIGDASAEALKAVALSESRPHIKARALCLLGDLKSAGPKPDYKQALQLHTQSLQLAKTLVADKHPAIRITAKEVLLDAHLGAMHDICWGAWREKVRAAENWAAKATEIARDLIKTEDGGQEYLFRLGSRALAADVGLQGKLDPAKWADDVVRSGEDLIAAAPEPGRKAELRWQVAMSLYDSMQIYQMRLNQDEALRKGELAIRYLEQSGRQSKSPAAAYLMGRTYFRMGAVYANNRKDHRTAVSWFEKAVPLLGQKPPAEAMADLGRLGDSFVSMGVSYWRHGYRNKAIALTEHGADLIEEAVRRGVQDREALVIPYTNLAAMQREVGDSAAATRMQQLAERAKGTVR